MAKRNPPVAKHRALVWGMSLGLVAMLGAAGSYFVENPGLIVHSTAGGTTPAQVEEAAQSAGMPGQSTDDAVLALMQKLQTTPNDGKTLLGLAQHFLHTGQAERAETFAMRAVMAAQGAESDPSKAAEAALPLYYLGMAQHSQQRYAEAAQSLEKSLSLKDDADTRFGLGILYRYFLKDEARGVAELKKALESPGASDNLRSHVAAEIDKKQ